MPRSIRPRDLVAAGIGVVLGLVGMLAYVGMGPGRAIVGAGNAGWVEVDWPFAVDPWWPSKAFRCERAACGGEVTLLVRAKLGFCNCATGVADDDELERISDFKLISSTQAPVGAGRPITVAGLKGRSRTYTIESSALAGGSALLIGVNDRCDAIVATAVVASSAPGGADTAIIAFLDSPRIRSWAEKTLGL